MAAKIPVKQILPLLDLASASAWSKRVHTDAKDWVPLRVDELFAVARRLRPREPWAFFLDDTQAQLLRNALRKAGLYGDPPDEAPLLTGSDVEDKPPPRRASSGEEDAGPGKPTTRRAGGRTR